ncbi:hypothetical protein MRX96_010935 [Rhipicephalus microplus]
MIAVWLAARVVLWSTNVFDLVEVQAVATRDDNKVLSSVPQLPASTSLSTTGQTAASRSVLVQDLSPTPTPGIFHEPSLRPNLNTTPHPTLGPTSTLHSSSILAPTRGSSPAPLLRFSSGPATGASSDPTTGISRGPTHGPTPGLFTTIAKWYMRTPPGICFRNRTFQFTTVRTL